MLMNRYLSALLSLFLLLSFSACHQENTSLESWEDISQSTYTSQTVTTDPILQETPAEEFEYLVRDNSVVYIREYIGNDTHVVIPEQIEGFPVSVIVASAFAENDTLVSVIMPDTITAIWDYAFANCSSLETVVMSKNVTEILNHAFFECTNLSSITLPETLIEIGSSAFENCTSLKHINIPASISSDKWGGYAFKNSGLETVDFEEGLNFIAPYTFWGSKIKSLDFPQSMRTIGANAFCFCEELESVTLNDSIEVIGSNAFGCSKITEIVIPASVRIMDNAFSACKDLRKIFFEGDAPEELFPLSPNPISCTIYYHEGAEGFTSPECNGYPTEIW